MKNHIVSLRLYACHTWGNAVLEVGLYHQKKEVPSLKGACALGVGKVSHLLFLLLWMIQ